MHSPATSREPLKVFHDGFDRTAYFQSPQKPRALLLLLHPVGSFGLGMVKTGKWVQDDYAVLAPDALALWSEKPTNPKTNPPVWSSSGVSGIQRRASAVPLDDAGFISACIDEADARLGQSLPVLLVGHSNGAAMGFRFLVEGRHRARVVAASLMAATWASAKGDLSAAVMFSSGDGDPIRPWEGHPGVPLPWFLLPQDPVELTTAQCVQTLGAQETAWQSQALGESVEARTNRSGRARLVALKLLRHGHVWPAGQPLPAELAARMGPNNEAIDLTALSLQFFAEELAASEIQSAVAERGPSVVA